MASLSNLDETAELILSLFVARLEQRNVEIPERRYVAPGSLIPWDSEQLIVNLMGIEVGQPGQPRADTATAATVVLTAQFGISILRIIPTLHGDGPLATMIPEPGDLDGAGGLAMTDAAALVLAAVEIQATDELVGPGEGFAIGGCQAVGPQGGFAGHRLLLSISLT